MNGRIGVQSKEGQGSKFRFTAVFEKHDGTRTGEPAIPAAMNNAPGNGLITHATSEDSLRIDARILLAEDNAINQKVALNILGKLGFRADAVPNGKEAVKAFEVNSYDLILMDVQMPVQDGISAAREIRALENGRLFDKCKNGNRITMIANAMKGDRQTCLDAGMDDYLAKPVNPEALLDKLQKWLPMDRRGQSNFETVGHGV